MESETNFSFTSHIFKYRSLNGDNSVGYVKIFERSHAAFSNLVHHLVQIFWNSQMSCSISQISCSKFCITPLMLGIVRYGSCLIYDINCIDYQLLKILYDQWIYFWYIWFCNVFYEMAIENKILSDNTTGTPCFSTNRHTKIGFCSTWGRSWPSNVTLIYAVN